MSTHWLCRSRAFNGVSITRFATLRTYATNNGQIPPSLLSQALDQKGHAHAQQSSAPRNDHVGPFQLGLSQPRAGIKQKKWTDLSTGGKVVRTTARATNLTVILLGASLSAVLVYALTSELFSKNSPTVLYGDACKRIKYSPKVAKYLHGPLRFHNNPPSSLRPRHRNRHVYSQVAVDSSGREHMLLNFHVEGRPPGSSAPPHDSESYLDIASEWTRAKASALSQLTFDESVAWTKDTANYARERALRIFKYLSGTPLPPPPIPEILSDEKQGMKKDAGSAWSFAGLFSGLKGVKGGPTETKVQTDGSTYTNGEVHADLVRNNEGYFVFRYLLIDIPNSQGSHPLRVFVERGPGVRENEPVMRFN